MEALRPEFSENRLFLGGDVGKSEARNVMQLLHACQVSSQTTGMGFEIAPALVATAHLLRPPPVVSPFLKKQWLI